MSITALAGRDVLVQKGSVGLNFKVTKTQMKAKLGETSGGLTAGARTYIGGPVDAKITCDGAYDAGAMPFALNEAVTLSVIYSGSITKTWTVLVESIDDTADFDNPVQVSVVFQTTGTHTFSIT